MLHLPRASRAGEPPRSTNVLTIFAAMLVTLGSSILLRAQNTEGTILGTVKDPSGAVVAGATVRLKNQGTGAERTTTTDTNGDYRFTNAIVGSYVLSIEANGFQKEEFSQFDLLARETRRLDVALKVGTQAESVNVQASEVPDVQTDTSVISETKTGREAGGSASRDRDSRPRVH